ncbi:hypothetical protein [Chitinophaga sp. CF418]|uniref:hypothetical protein n=1 Tax=Chitinophaga sp. CF418 TaxID=1855287 RepID=UPI000917F361|nr:hypothetical protein [Chitinophaga sp. CF418]SHN38532.1 hypothetical protein SAMN05216311_1119 [Chitinophaga sp. CF418]
MDSYHNHKLSSYWNLLSGSNGRVNENLLDKAAKNFQTLLRLIGKILADAAVELLYLIIFWFVITKMNQGRDLIVSLFEPDGIYGEYRVLFTILAVVSFSLSMWIIPAFIFQQRDDHYNKTNPGEYTSIFKRHLFFFHRTLPLIPFWLLAFALFNGKHIWLWFIGFSIIELIILSVITNIHSYKARTWYIRILVILTLLACGSTYYLFHRTYFEAKVALAILLYLLSFLMHFFYYKSDKLIIERHATAGGTPFKKYKENSDLYIFLLGVHIALVFALFFYHTISEFAPESILLYIFSLNIFFIDFVAYLINVSNRRKFIAMVLGILIIALYALSDSVNLNLVHYTLDACSDSIGWKNINRATFEVKYKMLKDDMDKTPATVPYPIILVAGEGGGSRAGMWFSQNMINFDYYTRGEFRKHIFSISTVSGSSVGLSTLFAFWQQNGTATDVDSSWLHLPSMVYKNNFVGSSISGLLFTDLWKALLPLDISSDDRNSELQNEEALYTQQACNEISGGKSTDMILKKNFMSFFYNRDKNGLTLRVDRPLVFINTCRSNDGRRGIFSPVKLSNDYFNDAIDIIGYLYEDSICDFSGRKIHGSLKKNISLVQACNTSELFPLFSAPAYIDSLGNFVDGGYHENSGLKTTLDVYRKLRAMFYNDSTYKHAYVIYIVYLKNSPSQKQLYDSRKSETPLVGPLQAFANQPFQGSASYFEEQARFLSRIDEKVKFIEVGLDHQWVIDADSTKEGMKPSLIDKQILEDLRTSADTVDGKIALNFPLARWLSNSIIRRMRVNASLYRNRNDSIFGLLNTVNSVNHVQTASLEPFKRLSSNVNKKMAVVSGKKNRNSP